MFWTYIFVRGRKRLGIKIHTHIYAREGVNPLCPKRQYGGWLLESDYAFRIGLITILCCRRLFRHICAFQHPQRPYMQVSGKEHIIRRDQPAWTSPARSNLRLGWLANSNSSVYPMYGFYTLSEGAAPSLADNIKKSLALLIKRPRWDSNPVWKRTYGHAPIRETILPMTLVTGK